MGGPDGQRCEETVRIQHGKKIPTTFRVFEGTETEWSLFQTAKISLTVESCGRKRLRMAKVVRKSHLGGTKMLKC